MSKVGRAVLFVALWLLYGLFWAIYVVSAVLNWGASLVVSAPQSLQIFSGTSLGVTGVVLVTATFWGRIKGRVSRLLVPVADKFRHFRNRGDDVFLLTGTYGALYTGSKGRAYSMQESATLLADRLPTEARLYAFAQTLRKQTERLAQRKEAMALALSSRFEPSSLTFTKFMSGVHSAERLMNENTLNLVRRIWAFDQTDYTAVAKKIGSRGLLRKDDPDEVILAEKMKLHQTAIGHVERGIETNENIMLQLDRLMAEIALISDMNTAQIEHLPAMQDISTLISDAKWYRDKVPVSNSGD